MDFLRGIEVDTVQVVRGFFLFGVAVGSILNGIPFLKRRYLDYGSRSSTIENKVSQQPVEKKPLNKPSVNLLDRIFGYEVPHRYFLHYYVVSVACSLFWGYQILAQGSVLRAISPEPSATKDGSKMLIEQVLLVWALMAVQGSRRLYESIAYLKPTASTMPVSIYLSGVSYYLFASVAIWIEGSDAVLTRTSLPDITAIGLPSIRTLICIPIFLVASGVQNDCHRYLASLPKYTLPVLPIFQDIVCPHYTMECLIYLSMAFISAPPNKWVNSTMLTVVVFVVINLGIVAKSTKEWSIKKFGEENVASRWRMIPWVW